MNDTGMGESVEVDIDEDSGVQQSAPIQLAPH